jgi:hypothetical protein
MRPGSRADLTEIDRRRERGGRLDNHVACCRKRGKRVRPVGRIEHDAALTGVEEGMRETQGLSPRQALMRGEAPHRRALRRLEAHDVGAEIGEQPPGIGGMVRGQIEHANAGERGRIGWRFRHQSAPSSLSRNASQRFIRRSWRL